MLSSLRVDPIYRYTHWTSPKDEKGSNFDSQERFIPPYPHPPTFDELKFEYTSENRYNDRSSSSSTYQPCTENSLLRFIAAIMTSNKWKSLFVELPTLLSRIPSHGHVSPDFGFHVYFLPDSILTPLKSLLADLYVYKTPFTFMHNIFYIRNVMESSSALRFPSTSLSSSTRITVAPFWILLLILCSLFSHSISSQNVCFLFELVESELRYKKEVCITINFAK